MLIFILHLLTTLFLWKETYAQTLPYDDQFGGSQSQQYLPNGRSQPPQYLINGGSQSPQFLSNEGSQSPQFVVNGGPPSPQYINNGGQQSQPILPNVGPQSPDFLPNGVNQPQQYLPNGGPQYILPGGQVFSTPGGIDRFNYPAQNPAYGGGNFPYQGLIPPIFGDQPAILIAQPDPSLYSQGSPVLPFSLNYPSTNFNGGQPAFIAGYPKPAHIPETPENPEKPKNTEATSTGKKSEKIILVEDNIRPKNKNKESISQNQNANLQSTQNGPNRQNDQQNLNLALEEQLKTYLYQKYKEQSYLLKNKQRNQNNINAYNNRPETYAAYNGQRYVLLQNGENYQNQFQQKQAPQQNNLRQNYFLNHDAYLNNQQSHINSEFNEQDEQPEGKQEGLLKDVLPLPLHNQVFNGKVRPLSLQRNDVNQHGYYNPNFFQGGYNLYNLDRANSNIDEDSVVIDAKYHNTKDAEIVTEDNPGTTEKPAKSSLAQSQPDAVAIAGVGGVASAGPKATALAGKRGLAVVSPKATAIANPTKEVDNEEIRFKL